MMSDCVVAIVPDDVLPTILSHIHGTGLGHTARVLRPRNTALRDQLIRAGVPTEQAPERIDDAPALLMIMAAARSPRAADIAIQHGASAAWIVSRAGSWSMVDDHLVADHTAQTPVSHQTPTPMAGDMDPEASDPI